MALPEQLDKCPLDKGCTSQSVWRDNDTGEIYSVRVDKTAVNPLPKFFPHVCTTKTVVAPHTLYTAKWHNLRTGFDRYVGPYRLQRSVLKEPADKPARRTSERDEWRLVELLEGAIEWKSIDIPEHYKASIKMKEDTNEA